MSEATTEPNLSPTRPDPAGQSSLEAGARVGRYELLEILGVGGGGAVYAAFDETLKRKVALKVLHARVGGARQGEMLREARALAQFSHPNVVAVYDVGQSAQGAGFIAMELAEGERLDQWLRRKGLAWHQVLRVFLEAGKGLAAVHRARLVHRDFKPGNVVVRSDGRVQLIDFGIARPDATDDGGGGVLAQVSGTPGYMSPEHMRGEPAGPHGDQFSFCCALYDALLGVMPFGESADTAQLVRIEKRQLTATPRPSKVPRKVLEVLRKGLAYQPAHRFSSMDALVRALTKTLPLDRLGWVGVGALSLAAGAAIGFMWLYSESRKSGCAADVRAAEALWSPEVRTELKQLLPPRTLQRVDGWADGLLDASREVCAAARAGTQDGAAVLESRACLARARLELSALLSAVRSSAALEAAQVDLAVEALAPAGECVAAGAPQEAAAARLLECQQRHFEAATLWTRGHWQRALEGAAQTLACAAQERAPELEASARLLQGAVLERAGHRAGARAAYQAAARAAVRTRGELLAHAWLSLARLAGKAEEGSRTEELLDWTDGLLERVPSAPETRARAALSRLRLQPQASAQARAAWLASAELGGGDPGQRALAAAAQALADPRVLEVALDELAALPAAPMGALLDLGEAALLAGPQPERARRLVILSEQALAPSGADAALARSHFASTARTLGAPGAALEAHRRIEQALGEGAPAFPRAVVALELARDLAALGQGAEARAAAARAQALADSDPELRAWLSSLVAAERQPR